jgi:outer membrane protein
MTKSVLLLFLMLFSLQNLSAQRLGFYDSDSILPKMSQYVEAQKQIQAVATKYEEQFRTEILALEQARDNLIYRKPLLSEEEFETAMLRIFENLLAVEEKRERFFGFRGEFFRQKQALSKSYLSVFNEAVEKVCKKQKLHFLIDRSADLLVVFGEPAYNYTQHLLTALGLKKSTKSEKPSGKKEEIPSDKPDTEKQDKDKGK